MMAISTLGLMAAFDVFYFRMRKKIINEKNTLDTKYLTPSDYTIMLTNLPTGPEFDEKAIIGLFHEPSYGDDFVKRFCPSFNISAFSKEIKRLN